MAGSAKDDEVSRGRKVVTPFTFKGSNVEDFGTKLRRRRYRLGLNVRLLG